MQSDALPRQKSNRQRLSPTLRGHDFQGGVSHRLPSWRRKPTNEDGNASRASFPLDVKKIENDNRASLPLSPFEKIKIESDRKVAHGHPVILPAAYGTFGPVFDVFALFQNAVRKQILEAYNMLEVLLRYKYEVTHTHTEMLFDWFETFEDVVLVLFDIENTQVFPFLEEQGVDLPESLSVEGRKTIYDRIETSLELVVGRRDKVRMLPPGESIPHISTLLNEFLHVIIRYYNTQSKLLPRLIFEADIDAEAEMAIRSRFINALRAKNNYSTSLPFVAHWLSASQLRSWKANYLGSMLSVRFEQWSRKFEATHGAIPQNLAKKLASGIQDEDPDSPPPSLFSGRSLSARRRYKNHNF